MRGCEIARLRCYFGGTVASSSKEALVRRRLPLRKEPRFCISLSIITASTAMYLLGIKGCGLTSMLFFLGLSLLLTIQEAESGMLMSKGIGRSKINCLNYLIRLPLMTLILQWEEVEGNISLGTQCQELTDREAYLLKIQKKRIHLKFTTIIHQVRFCY